MQITAGFVFSENEIGTGEYYDKNNLQGKIQMYEYCSNITYSDNNFINGGFLDNKKSPNRKYFSLDRG